MLTYKRRSRATINELASPVQLATFSLDSAFDLANVAALQAYEKNKQLRVGDFVQVWSLCGGCKIASRHTGVSGCVTFVGSLGRAVPRGCRPNPGGTRGPVRITGRELMTAATPRNSLHAAVGGRRP